MKFKDAEEFDYAKNNDGFIPQEFKTNEKGISIIINEKFVWACGTIEKPANGLMTVELGKLDEEKDEFYLITRKVKSFSYKQTTAMSVEYEGGPGTYRCDVKFDAKTGPGKQLITGTTTVKF